MSSSSFTSSATYSAVDIENVVRRFTADLKMIAQSSGAITESQAKEYAEDVEMLAKKGYLAAVDLTLLQGGSLGTEVRASKYSVNTNAGDLTNNRPGNALWPRVSAPYLRIVLTYTSAYDGAARAATQPSLNISWTPTSADTSHRTLSSNGSRSYASNGWGMERKDFGA